MADQCSIRVMRELSQLQKGDNLAMTVHFNERNVRQVKALLIGPPGTPYALGFYRFDITFPPDYPASPPEVQLLTTNRGRTRFGPNLYATGKVCLSILGTWSAASGEEWSPAQGLESVLLSIQSLLSANPYINEPGYEDATDPMDEENSQVYKAKICHENLRLAVIEPLELALGITTERSRDERASQPSSPLHETVSSADPGPFSDFCKQRFLWYLEIYKRAIQEGIEKEAARNRRLFPTLPFEMSHNTMLGRWDYPNLQERLLRVERMLMKDTQEWPVRGLEMAKDQITIAMSLRGQHEQISSELKRRFDSMIDLTMVDDNPFLWLLTYIGRPMTQYDGGILKVKIYISPNHPVEQPRVFLETPLYHVRVSTQNALIYLPARAEEMRDHIQGIIDSLEEEKPPFNPLMTVNPDATELCWVQRSNSDCIVANSVGRSRRASNTSKRETSTCYEYGYPTLRSAVVLTFPARRGCPL